MTCLRPLKHWDREFESHLKHGCLCAFILCLFCLMCAVSGLAKGWFSFHGVLPTVYRSRNWKSGLGPTEGCWAVDRYIVKGLEGRAVAQAVSRRLLTAAARVRSQISLCGICGGLRDTGAGFLRVLRFPLIILIPPTAPHSSLSIIRCWYNRPISGRRTKWTQSHSTPRN
jgi:hypothetical protein